MNRIDRLTAILIQMQTKRVVKAEEIADRFEISLRTVYRDVKALMEAGVPIGSEAGKGYFIVDGFHLPPVMFTQDEASAMLLAGKLVDKMADKSVRAAYESAIFKVKAVLHESEKDHLENLQAHIEVMIRSKTEEKGDREFPDHFMTEIQRAVAKHQVVEMEYVSVQDDETKREIEPIGLFYYNLSWHLIAWCRLRNGYRDFRCDRIKTLHNTQKKFEGRNILSLQEYLQTIHHENQNLVKAVVLFDKKSIRGRSIYGSVSQHDEGDKLRVEFLMDNINLLARWLLPYGSSAEVLEPAALRAEMKNLVHELYQHFVNNDVLTHT